MYWSPVWTKSFTDTQTQHNVMHSLTMNTYVVHCRFIKLIFSDQMLNSMLNTLTIRDYSQIKGKKTHELFDKIDYSFMACHIAFLSGKYDKFCQKFFWSFDKYYQSLLGLVVNDKSMHVRCCKYMYNGNFSGLSGRARKNTSNLSHRHPWQPSFFIKQYK